MLLVGTWLASKTRTLLQQFSHPLLHLISTLPLCLLLRVFVCFEASKLEAFLCSGGIALTWVCELKTKNKLNTFQNTYLAYYINMKSVGTHVPNFIRT